MIALAGIKIETVAWSTLAPLANHLWQSTIFAGTAGVLTLLLRKNRAQTRYWLWLIASAKFLVPFSLLISLGSYLGSSKPASISQPVFTVVMQEMGQPFSQNEPDLQAKPATSRPQTLPARALVILLATAWACGSLAVVLTWCLRWRRVALAMRPALPANAGREFGVLRRLEKARGTKPIGLFSSDAALEPGIVGIVRPVLLLPAGISDRLTDAQMEAIMAHELCHIRRRDNMVSALLMVVEAIFWFHPLVWWMGSRLVDERERACDEEVLRLGSDPQVYAQGILKVCEFYLESPLVCVAGVTGSSLTKRIEKIMRHRMIHQLDLKKKLLLAFAGIAAIALPVVFGVLHALAIPQLPRRFIKTWAQSPGGKLEFTIKPARSADEPWRVQVLPKGDLIASAVPVGLLLSYAYDVPANPSPRLSPLPDWTLHERYDIETKPPTNAVLPSPQNSHTRNQIQQMIREVLSDRFRLVMRIENKTMPVYVLTVASGGPKLQKSAIAEKDCAFLIAYNAPDGCHNFAGGFGHPLNAKAIDMDDLVDYIGNWTDLPVVNRTALSGLFTVNTGGWFPMRLPPPPPNTTPDANHFAGLPTIFTVLGKLGLELKRQNDILPVYTVERIERPATN